MKDQLQTIRQAWEEVLANFDHAISGGIWRVAEGSQTWEAVQAAKQALATLAQLEAMAGEQEPVYAAPVAQQPQAEPITEAVIDAYLEDYEMRGETEDGRDACYTPSEGEKFLIKDAIMGLLAEIPPKQPQAEDTIKRQAQKIAELTADRDGWIEAHARLYREYHDFRKAAPQQAEAVPPTHVLVPVEPDETWAYRVIRHHQPNLDVGCKAWLDCLEELLYWHEAIAASKKEAGHE